MLLMLKYKHGLLKLFSIDDSHKQEMTMCFERKKFKENITCKTNLHVSPEVATLRVTLTWLSSNAYVNVKVSPCH